MAKSKKNIELLTLADAQKQFQAWRVAKMPGETIPDRLWNTAAGLLKNTSYKRSHIGKALGISGGQLSNKFPKQFTNKPTDVAPKFKNRGVFVEAPLQSIANRPPSSAQIIIEKNNGAKLIFASVTQEQFAILIKTFME